MGNVVGDDVIGHWAGQIRRGAAPMGAVGTGVVYAVESSIQQGLDDIFGGLEEKSYLAGCEKHDFFTELGEAWSYLTQVHQGG